MTTTAKKNHELIPIDRLETEIPGGSKEGEDTRPVFEFPGGRIEKIDEYMVKRLDGINYLIYMIEHSVDDIEIDACYLLNDDPDHYLLAYISEPMHEQRVFQWFIDDMEQDRIIEAEELLYGPLQEEEHDSKGLLRDEAAISKYEKAALAGDAKAQYLLGRHYFKKAQPNENDLAYAYYWLTKASKNGFGRADVTLVKVKNKDVTMILQKEKWERWCEEVDADYAKQKN